MRTSSGSPIEPSGAAIFPSCRSVTDCSVLIDAGLTIMTCGRQRGNTQAARSPTCGWQQVVVAMSSAWRGRRRELCDGVEVAPGGEPDCNPRGPSHVKISGLMPGSLLVPHEGADLDRVPSDAPNVTPQQRPT